MELVEVVGVVPDHQVHDVLDGHPPVGRMEARAHPLGIRQPAQVGEGLLATPAEGAPGFKELAILGHARRREQDRGNGQQRPAKAHRHARLIRQDLKASNVGRSA